MADRIAAAKLADTDALSPRDANVQLPHRVVDVAKVKMMPASKPVQKEKELPPQPPPLIYEPPSFDRKDGAVYQVGKILGKGGFAVCYEGYLPTKSGNKRKYALKVVRSKMPTKMEQKVSSAIQEQLTTINANIDMRTVPNRTADSLQDEAAKYCAIPQGFFLPELHLSRPGAVSQWLIDGYGQAKKGTNGARSAVLFSANCRRYQIHAWQGYNPSRP